MPITRTSVVSWKMPMASVTIAGITVHRACGSTTRCKACQCDRPREHGVSPRLDPHQRGVVLAGTLQPEADRIARMGAAAIDGVGQQETGGSRRKQAGDVFVRDDQHSGEDGAHDAATFPELFADAAACVAGLALAGELLDLRPRCLDFVFER